MKNVVFISGHPDDHLTSAGFLSLLKDNGYELYEIVLTSGSGGYKHSTDKEKIELVRRKEFEKAEKILGLKKSFYLGYDEHSLLMNKENVETIVKILRQIRPEIIIIPNSEDYHETHLETNRIALKSIRTAMKKRKLELGQPINPIIILEWEFSVPRQPDVIIDVSTKWGLKTRLLTCYTSQNNSMEEKKLRSLNEYRGSIIGAEFAEGFKINQFLPIRIDKLLGLE